MSLRSGKTWGFIATAAVIFVLPVGLYDLQLPDEPRVSHTSLEMLRSGEFAVPHVNGEEFLQTPPLYYWLLALWFQFAGFHADALARAVSVVSAVGTVVLVGALANRYTDKRVAFFSMGVLVSFFQFWEISHRVVVDMTLTFFTFLAFFGFVCILVEERTRWWHGVLLGLGTGAAFLTKGLPGPVFLGSCVVFVLVRHRVLWTKARFGALLVSALVGGATVAPWILALYRNDPSYVSGVLVDHVWHRVVHGGVHNPSNWAFFHRMLLHLMPWTPFFLVVMFLQGRGVVRRSDRTKVEPTSNVQKTLLSECLFWFFLLPFVLLLLSRSKRNLYLLPTLPAVAMLIGVWLSSHYEHRWFERGVRIVACGGALVALAGLGVLMVTEIGRDSTLVFVGLILYLYWFVRWWRSRKHPDTAIRRDRWTRMALVTICFCVASWGGVYFAMRNPRYSAARYGYELVRVESAGHEIHAYGLTEREVGATAWYLRHPFPHFHELEGFSTIVSSVGDVAVPGEKKAVVVEENALASFQDGELASTLERWHEWARVKVRRRTLVVLTTEQDPLKTGSDKSNL